MESVERYRKIIQKLLGDRAARSQRSNSQVEAQTIFDTERDHYQLVYVGWRRNGDRDYGCLIHLDLKEGKIWIQYDGTEGGIAQELVEQGVPKEDIVLGFHPPSVRKLTEFAVG
ncbi:XisI protein [Cyanobacteria bacterium FACHB-DQ100]|nr:XisI protein [Cyanobacteria bacterium FACHB-DQ100]